MACDAASSTVLDAKTLSMFMISSAQRTREISSAERARDIDSGDGGGNGDRERSELFSRMSRVELDTNECTEDESFDGAW